VLRDKVSDLRETAGNRAEGARSDGKSGDAEDRREKPSDAEDGDATTETGEEKPLEEDKTESTDGEDYEYADEYDEEAPVEEDSDDYYYDDEYYADETGFDAGLDSLAETAA
jgi:hypothetical protein